MSEETPHVPLPRMSFMLQAVGALAAITLLNVMIARYVPFRIEGMDSFYLIFFYHFPSAMNCLLFFTVVLVMGIRYLRDHDLRWDRHARVAGEVGLLACSVTLVTGSVWAKSAWNTWWDFSDPRLMSAAVMWLTYAGYVTLQLQMEDGTHRRRYAAVFGILAWLNIPFVHYAIRLLGSQSHPMEITAEDSITVTQWYGVAAFTVVYTLIYRWKLHREQVRERVEEVLGEVRRLEEGATA